ncbi:DUF222 domain-containing protein [Nocardia otitidiscaviarum]|uniref:DUF222 domain-containing protein n=1 Tax=Nocardia otitidiscaviarum TaxID=1823 RepID=UPI000585B106|nr:DUF222 domain-containing protein [Nocardia otitidiscaviarum]
MQFRDTDTDTDTDTEPEGLLAEGAISATHTRAVMRVMNRLPDAIDTATRAVAEQQLADATRMLAPEQVTHVGDRLLGFLDPDNPHGWATETVPAGSALAGRTQWRPPVEIDPHRTPQVNHLHHPEHILAESLKRYRAELTRLRN